MPEDYIDALTIYEFLMFRSLYICMIAAIRFLTLTDTSAAFEDNQVFKVIAYFASYAIAQVLALLIASLITQTRVITYAIFKFIGTFSAFLAPFSLLMIIVLPPELNWIGYLVVFMMFGISVTCFYLDDHQPDESDKLSSFFHKFVIAHGFLVCWINIAILSRDFNWIMNPWVYAILWIEVTYHFVSSLIFIYKKTRKDKLGLPLIRQEEENASDRPPYPSYLMHLGNPWGL